MPQREGRISKLVTTSGRVGELYARGAARCAAARLTAARHGDWAAGLCRHPPEPGARTWPRRWHTCLARGELGVGVGVGSVGERPELCPDALGLLDTAQAELARREQRGQPAMRWRGGWQLLV